MADIAHKQTDQIIREIEDRIWVEYSQAQREIQAKLDDYLDRFALKDQKWQEWVSRGNKTQQQYRDWKTGQIAIGRRWEEMRDSIAEDLTNVHDIATSMATSYMPDVYALNHDYQTFQVEKDSHVDTSYTLYSREAAEKIFRDDPQMLPDPGKKVSAKIAREEAKRWNNKHIQSVMMQAILQGNNISDIATRLSNAVCDYDRKAAIRNARTMATGAQNRGRIDAMKRCEEKGIHQKKMWRSTIDMRTRHAHRQLDGQEVGIDEKFKSEYGEIAYPGDITARPENVWNCRCTLISKVEGWESKLEDQRSLERIEGMSYDEWKDSRVEKTKNILRPDERQDAARAKYIHEYREDGGKTPVKSGRDMTLDVDAKNPPNPPPPPPPPPNPPPNPNPPPPNPPPKNQQQQKQQQPPAPQTKSKPMTKDEAIAKITSNSGKAMVASLASSKVRFLPVETMDDSLTEDQIIKKISGGDMTPGSCFSAAMAYVANKFADLDVLDFRGLGSRSAFAKGARFIAGLPGLSVQKAYSMDDFESAKEVLATAEVGKDYMLITGKHAAMVRRKDEKFFDYLELQSYSSSGWKNLRVNELGWRFGCTNHRQGLDRPSYLIDAESLGSNEEFQALMGYINTEPKKQKKGARGFVR